MKERKMNLMELAKKREIQQKKLHLAIAKLQTLQNEKNRIEIILDKINKNIAQEVAGEAPAASRTVKLDMRKLFDDFGHRFNANSYPQWLAEMMADGTFQPNKKGIYTVLDARNLVEWAIDQKVGYMTIWQAMRRIAKVYNIAWPSHAAGMKVC